MDDHGIESGGTFLYFEADGATAVHGVAGEPCAHRLILHERAVLVDVAVGLKLQVERVEALKQHAVPLVAAVLEEVAQQQRVGLQVVDEGIHLVDARHLPALGHGLACTVHGVVGAVVDHEDCRVGDGDFLPDAGLAGLDESGHRQRAQVFEHPEHVADADYRVVVALGILTAEEVEEDGVRRLRAEVHQGAHLAAAALEAQDVAHVELHRHGTSGAAATEVAGHEVGYGHDVADAHLAVAVDVGAGLEPSVGVGASHHVGDGHDVADAHLTVNVDVALTHGSGHVDEAQGGRATERHGGDVGVRQVGHGHLVGRGGIATSGKGELDDVGCTGRRHSGEQGHEQRHGCAGQKGCCCSHTYNLFMNEWIRVGRTSPVGVCAKGRSALQR